jgi:hypothetical protein
MRDEGGRFVSPRGAPHGSHARYSAGCRCDKCRRGQAKYQLAYLRRRDDPLRKGDTATAKRMLECMASYEPAIALLFSLASFKPLLQALDDPISAGQVERLHEVMWRVSGPMRVACRCLAGEGE